MDPKASLSPDLKQIYEKIMSTPTKNPAAASSSLTTPPPPLQTPQMPSTPPAPPPPAQPTTLQSSLGSPGMIPNPTAPSPLPTAPGTPQMQAAAAAASTAPPRQIKSSTDGFVFTSGQKSKEPIHIPAAQPGNAQAAIIHKSSSGGATKVVIGVLALTFMVAYTFFWLLIFGYINKSMFGL